jgi:hypothetical protein
VPIVYFVTGFVGPLGRSGLGFLFIAILFTLYFL